MSRQCHYSSPSSSHISFIPLSSSLPLAHLPSSPLPAWNPSSWGRFPSASQEQHNTAQRLCQTFSFHPERQIKWKIHQLSWLSCLVLPVNLNMPIHQPNSPFSECKHTHMYEMVCVWAVSSHMFMHIRHVTCSLTLSVSYSHHPHTHPSTHPYPPIHTPTPTHPHTPHPPIYTLCITFIYRVTYTTQTDGWLHWCLLVLVHPIWTKLGNTIVRQWPHPLLRTQALQ